MISRRRWLQSLGLLGTAAAGLAGYSYQRGLRIPPLRWEPRPLESSFSYRDVLIESEHIIRTSDSADPAIDVALRAYAPEPSLLLKSDTDQRISILLNNIGPQAELVTDTDQSLITEQRDGINCSLSLPLRAGQTVALQWRLPELNEGYRFASIGDSGGAEELAWCLQRAHQLGALFFVHLGDFHYAPGEYQSAIELFRSAELPCYVCIGNHDFHDGGLLYGDFLHEIGPFNHAFSIGRTRFVNIDTASDIWPAAGGQRGAFMRQVISQSDDPVATIAFTHRPLFDPLPDSHHDLGQGAEFEWLVSSLQQAGISTLLSGHIHIQARETIEGIDNIIVGQGLGHQDLLTADINWSKMAVGDVSADGQVSIGFAPLKMPMQLHCSPRTEPVRASLRHSDKADLIGQVEQACANRSKGS